MRSLVTSAFGWTILIGRLWGQWTGGPTGPINGGTVAIGTGLNNVYDGAAGGRPLVVSGADNNTAIGSSLASLTIVNANTTPRNSAQLNFATLNAPTSGIQYSAATISAVFDTRSGDGLNKYASADLVFTTAPGYLTGNGGPTERLRITSVGNVGIGTANPRDAFDLRGNILTTGGVVFNSHFSDTWHQTTAGYGAYLSSEKPAGTMYFWNTTASAADAANPMPAARLAVAANGNVGIGTTNPGSYKVAVEGTIGGREVIVTNSAWADYVFRPGYRLNPLSEVAAYIKQNHHLPDIPSEAEVKQQGIASVTCNRSFWPRLRS